MLSFFLCLILWSGGYDKEDKAARAYDLAALKYWGPSTHINFPVSLLAKFPIFLYSTNLKAHFSALFPT